MSFPARVFRVLLASPSDVTEEREIAVRTIQEWNDLNAAERQLVLLPLRWETHSAPEYGRRPQEVINRQVVDRCDLLVGIFWTRIGSPTGVSDSGTIEEIERVAIKGKPVMLYFSQAHQDPEELDLDQLAKLREFKAKTFPKALVEKYGNSIEFKEKLSKQLEIQLRGLLVEEGSGQPGATEVRPVTDVVLHFADPETGEDLGTEINLDTTLVEVVDFEMIPDYLPTKTGVNKEESGSEGRPRSAGGSLSLDLLGYPDVNRDYYRQRVTYVVLRGLFRPLRFWLVNRGGIGARDVYIDLTIAASSESLILVPNDRIPKSMPSKRTGFVFGLERQPSRPDEIIAEASDTWSWNLEIKALQPQRTVTPPTAFFLGATESCELEVTARIYADTLPEPAVQHLKVMLNVSKVSISIEELLSGMIQEGTESGELEESRAAVSRDL